MQLITTSQLDAIKTLINQINEQYTDDPSIKKISISTYDDEDSDGNTMLCASIHVESWPTHSPAEEAMVLSDLGKIEKIIIAAGYPCEIVHATGNADSHSATYVVSDTVKSHTNKNGVPYYSRPDDEHGTIYSFSVDFEDVWTQDDQDYHDNH